MRTIHHILLLVTCIAGSAAWAYPPDNAAVLYYRAFSLIEYPEESELRDALWDFRKGDIELTESARLYLDQHEHVIKILMDAAMVSQCDWGLDYSQGIEMMFPKLSQARHAGNLLLAYARKEHLAGNTNQALDLCWAVHRMGRHVDNDCIVSHLVGIALNAITNNIIRDILGDGLYDEGTLTHLRSTISEITIQMNTLKAAVQKDSIHCANSICPAGQAALLKCLRDGDPDETTAIAKIETADAAFWESSLQYYLEFMVSVQNALDLPFAEAYAKLGVLEKKPVLDAKTNDHALIATILTPAIRKCLCLDIKNQTDFNALKTGMEILLIKSRTGRLPDRLPPNMPKDLFSGLDFVYEKTNTGFVLHCQAPEPSKKEILEFAFVVP